MAQITAAMVKELREMTGAGMMECKKALVEAEGDMDAAVDVLRKRGEATAEKKQGRATNEGVVACYICPNCGVAGIVEVSCETDFVSGNEKFGAFANKIAKAVAMGDAKDVDDLKTKDVDGQTVADTMTEAIHLFGENMNIARFGRIDPEQPGAVVDYIHMGGKIGVIVDFGFTKPETAKAPEFLEAGRNVAMQVAAADPVAVNRDEVDPAVIEHEMSIYRAQAAESGKPEAIQEKMATGRLEKYFKEFCLIEQAYVKDPEKQIKTYLAEVSKALGDTITVRSFIRFRQGEDTSK